MRTEAIVRARERSELRQFVLETARVKPSSVRWMRFTRYASLRILYLDIFSITVMKNLPIVIGFWVTVGSNFFSHAGEGETAPFVGSIRERLGENTPTAFSWEAAADLS
ncbi:hypothetical protein AVEN_92700-1 [Araneus ventricosus]|uniref:Uncharacterized protein n=1 Tax=Araneus ventricosus TaxID=182803 RepID=A0A4Y2HM09_ARAVE|nr:hypothetical protein AVEN_92700-1 [Araneus ventricosus]